LRRIPARVSSSKSDLILTGSGTNSKQRAVCRRLNDCARFWDVHRGFPTSVSKSRAVI
jgi:hypothetical protein